MTDFVAWRRWRGLAPAAGRFAIALALIVLSSGTVMTQGADGLDGEARSKPAEKAKAEPPPMRFEWVREGPDAACGGNCREWVSASGKITPDTGRDFEAFIKTHNPQGQVMVLESEGGSVVGALALGRAIRRLDMTVAVGKTLPVPSASDAKRASYSPKASCSSMCPFVLLGGVRRHVPQEARIAVHQSWPSNMRADPTAATYSAQHVAGMLRVSAAQARYTIDMGGDIELFEITNRIPPWEQLRRLTRAEILRMRLHTTDTPFERQAVAARAPPPSAAAPVPSSAPVSGSARASAPNSRWALIASGGERGITRRHPLTVEGEEIGSFVFTFGCADAPDMLSIRYLETRRIANAANVDSIRGVLVAIGRERVPLKVESSRANGGRLESTARGTISRGLVSKLVESERASFAVATLTTGKARTIIMLGNTGLSAAMPQLTANCLAAN